MWKFGSRNISLEENNWHVGVAHVDRLHQNGGLIWVIVYLFEWDLWRLPCQLSSRTSRHSVKRAGRSSSLNDAQPKRVLSANMISSKIRHQCRPIVRSAEICPHLTDKRKTANKNVSTSPVICPSLESATESAQKQSKRKATCQFHACVEMHIIHKGNAREYKGWKLLEQVV